MRDQGGAEPAKALGSRLGQREVRLLLQRLDRVLHGHADTCCGEERQIVLAVADCHGGRRRLSQLAERGVEARRLADAGRQHHHGVAVVAELEVQPEVAKNSHELALVLCRGRADGAPHRERLHPQPLELGDQRGRDRRGQ